MKEGWKPEYPEKTPGDELQIMPHTRVRKFKLTVTPRVAQRLILQNKRITSNSGLSIVLHQVLANTQFTVCVQSN